MTSPGGESVSVVSCANNTVVATINVEGYPEGIAYDPAKGELFVSDDSAGAVSVISDSTDTVMRTIGLGGGNQTGSYSPKDVVYNPIDGEIFAVNQGSNSISVISDSTNQVVAIVNIVSNTSPAPIGGAFDSARDEVFVTNSMSDTVSVISGKALTSISSTVPEFPANSLVVVTFAAMAVVALLGARSGRRKSQ